jgi:flavodoxin I
MNKIAILYGSSTGNTKAVADKLAKLLNADMYDVATSSPGILSGYKNLVLGVSTWGLGDLQDDWEDFLPKLVKADLTNKVVAIYGLGDAEGYPDTFVDGIGTIYKAIMDKGCKITGLTDTSDYKFDESMAVVDGKFVGLPLDEDNDSRLTNSRLQKWVEKIKSEFV